MTLLDKVGKGNAISESEGSQDRPGSISASDFTLLLSLLELRSFMYCRIVNIHLKQH